MMETEYFEGRRGWQYCCTVSALCGVEGGFFAGDASRVIENVRPTVRAEALVSQ